MPIVYSYNNNKGIKKEKNEDAINIAKNKKGIFLSVICDGVSSHSDSKYSSNLLVNNIVKSWKKNNYEEKDEIIIWLKNEILKNNDLIITKSKQRKTKMGSTIIITVVKEDFCITANVGDSLTYLINNKSEIILASKDDSFAGVLLDAGVISEDEAKIHPKRHTLTQALGIDKNIDIHINFHNLKYYNYVLSCSDGLTSMLDKQEIVKIILNEDLSNSINTLINRANENGGLDNISLVIFKILRGENYDR